MKATDPTFSASEESFARRAAGIPEIRDIICDFINIPDEGPLDDDTTPNTSACSSLARLLRTSQDFFFSAARILWGTWEIEAKDLFVLLPGVTKSRWKHSAAVCAIMTVASFPFLLRRRRN
jgi:hypothetical protein